MRELYMMKCGHVNNATKGYTDIPACAICSCFEIDHKVTDPVEGLEGRTAKCGECSNTTQSKWSLPFFKYCPDKDDDEYYCGCYGWD